MAENTRKPTAESRHSRAVFLKTGLPSWNRPLSVFVIAVAVVAMISSITELVKIFFIQGLDLGLSPSLQDPSPVPFIRYSNHLSLASAIFAAFLTPALLAGGVLAYQFREIGRRILVISFALRTVWYAGCLIFWLYHILLFASQPRLFPALLAWGGLAAIIVSGGIGALFLVLLRSESTTTSFREYGNRRDATPQHRGGYPILTPEGPCSPSPHHPFRSFMNR